MNELYLWSVLPKPVVSFTEIIKDDTGAIMLLGWQDNWRRGICFRSDPGAVECVGNQQYWHQANHCRGNFILDWITWITFLCCLAVTTGNIQILEKYDNINQLQLPWKLRTRQLELTAPWETNVVFQDCQSNLGKVHVSPCSGLLGTEQAILSPVTNPQATAIWHLPRYLLLSKGVNSINLEHSQW